MCTKLGNLKFNLFGLSCGQTIGAMMMMMMSIVITLY